MRQKSGAAKRPAEEVVKDIRRATRRLFSAEEKISIVLKAFAVRRASRSCAGEKVLLRRCITAGRTSFWRPANRGLPATPATY